MTAACITMPTPASATLDDCAQHVRPQWMAFITAPRTGEWFLAFTELAIGWADIGGVGPVRFARWDASIDAFVEGAGYTIVDEFTHWAPFAPFPTGAQLVLIEAD